MSIDRARYEALSRARGGGDERQEWTDARRADGHECRHCGADVLELANGGAPMAREVCRVFGDENGDIERCTSCTPYRSLSVAARKGIKVENGGVTLMGCSLGGEM